MKLARAALSSRRGRILLGLLAAWLAWQAWLVLHAPSKVAGGFLRISYGPQTTEAEVDAFLAEWSRIAGRQRAA